VSVNFVRIGTRVLNLNFVSHIVIEMETLVNVILQNGHKLQYTDQEAAALLNYLAAEAPDLLPAALQAAASYESLVSALEDEKKKAGEGPEQQPRRPLTGC
jgi:hypothetical protein